MGSAKFWSYGLSIVVIGFLALTMYAYSAAKSRHEREELALEIAQIGGNQYCALAWIVAREEGVDAGRTPSAYSPDVLTQGPPQVMSCGMLRTGGVAAEPLVFIRRCRELDRRCIALQP